MTFIKFSANCLGFFDFVNVKKVLRQNLYIKKDFIITRSLKVVLLN